MADRNDEPNLAVFCDFENVAIGAREARYQDFDIHLVLERLLDKGRIVVKKAYADWDRYKTARRALHEAAFELIEVPHVSYSGKNSADIRMVVDALDLCYVKHHVDLFVLVTGDSDFSPLVSKLRENNKRVIGLGVKSSTSDLLIDNCDEFIYYDDLVRGRAEARHAAASSAKGGRGGERGGGGGGGGRGDDRRGGGSGGGGGGGGGDARNRPMEDRAGGAVAMPASGTPQGGGGSVGAGAGAGAGTGTGTGTGGGAGNAAANVAGAAVGGGAGGPNAGANAPGGGEKEKPLEQRQLEALDMVLDVVEGLFQDREGSVWGSQVKQTLKRKRPNFSERFHGYRTFNELLEDAAKRGLLVVNLDEKSGGYVISDFGPNA